MVMSYINWTYRWSFLCIFLSKSDDYVIQDGRQKVILLWEISEILFYRTAWTQKFTCMVPRCSLFKVVKNPRWPPWKKYVKRHLLNQLYGRFWRILVRMIGGSNPFRVVKKVTPVSKMGMVIYLFLTGYGHVIYQIVCNSHATRMPKVKVKLFRSLC